MADLKTSLVPLHYLPRKSLKLPPNETLATQIVLKSLLSECSPDEQAALSRHLGTATEEALQHSYDCCGKPLSDETTEETLLKAIHPSWISPYIRSLPEKEIAFFLAALGSQSALLRKELLYTGDLPALTPLAKQFLQKTLLLHLSSDIEDLLPPPFLPESPLKPLLSLSEESAALSLQFLGPSTTWRSRCGKSSKRASSNRSMTSFTPQSLPILKSSSKAQSPSRSPPCSSLIGAAIVKSLRASFCSAALTALGKRFMGKTLVSFGIFCINCRWKRVGSSKSFALL